MTDGTDRDDWKFLVALATGRTLPEEAKKELAEIKHRVAREAEKNLLRQLIEATKQDKSYQIHRKQLEDNLERLSALRSPGEES